MPSLNNLTLDLMKKSNKSYLPITQRIAYFKGESQEILRLEKKQYRRMLLQPKAA
jgi:hypothetical protein